MKEKGLYWSGWLMISLAVFCIAAMIYQAFVQ